MHPAKSRVAMVEVQVREAGLWERARQERLGRFHIFLGICGLRLVML